MINYLKSEILKQKHRFSLKLLWLAPIVTIATVLFLMAGSFFTISVYNWWYTTILPGAFAMMVAFSVSAEKKFNRHGMFSVCVNKKKIWISQVIWNTILLLVINLIFWGVVVITGMFFGFPIPFADSFVAAVVLFVTFLWQTPLLMFSSEKTGAFVTIILSLFCNIGFGIFFAPTRLWAVPFAIPARLMCPVLKVMPNNLPLPEGSPLGDSSVIFPGIMVSVVLFTVLLILTSLWFERREVK